MDEVARDATNKLKSYNQADKEIKDMKQFVAVSWNILLRIIGCCLAKSCSLYYSRLRRAMENDCEDTPNSTNSWFFVQNKASGLCSRSEGFRVN